MHRLDVRMHMWGHLIPKNGMLDFPISSTGRDVCKLLASKDNSLLDIVNYLYTGMDWRRCTNISFTIFEVLDEIIYIIIMFS
jgi:hypothetical protein